MYAQVGVLACFGAGVIVAVSFLQAVKYNKLIEITGYKNLLFIVLKFTYNKTNRQYLNK